MKKLIAGLLGLVLSVMCVLPAMAQNNPNSYNAWGVGVVSYSLNSGGSFYGQEFNSASASNWSLGYGASQTTAGTAVLTWDSNAHVGFKNSVAPTVLACGGAGTFSVVNGSDAAGDVSIGTATGSSCSITFAAAYASIPHCFCTDRKTSSASCSAQPGTTSVTFVGTNAAGTTGAFASGDAIDYVCFGN